MHLIPPRTPTKQDISATGGAKSDLQARAEPRRALTVARIVRRGE